MKRDKPVVLICSDKVFGKQLNFGEKFLRSYEVGFCGTLPELQEKLKNYVDPVWIFFTFWSTYIPERVFSFHNAVVFHMTDLPFGRGGTPLQNLIVRGFATTKLSAIRCSHKYDSGPVYLKTELSLEGSATEIFQRAESLMPGMIETIVVRELVPSEQTGPVSYFARRSPDMSEIPQRGNLKEAYDHVRMLDADGYPRAFIVWGDYKIEFARAQLLGDRVEGFFRLSRNESNS